MPDTSASNRSANTENQRDPAEFRYWNERYQSALNSAELAQEALIKATYLIVAEHCRKMSFLVAGNYSSLPSSDLLG